MTLRVSWSTAFSLRSRGRGSGVYSTMPTPRSTGSARRNSCARQLAAVDAQLTPAHRVGLMRLCRLVLPMSYSPAVLNRVADRISPGASVQTITRLTGGVSADVYRLDLSFADGGSGAVVLRAHGATHGGHDAALEFALLRAVHRLGLLAPEPLLVDSSRALISVPYLVIAFAPGSTAMPAQGVDHQVSAMAAMLRRIHAAPTESLPALPDRLDPLSELFDFLPEGDEWAPLRGHLQTLEGTAFHGTRCLLHGDYWPENILWQNGAITAVLDWEDAAIGDPLSDLASARVELRYLHGAAVMRRFLDAYMAAREVDLQRLALWQIYVAAAAAKYMGAWGLPEAREAHMRREALASVREAGAYLMGQRRDLD